MLFFLDVNFIDNGTGGIEVIDNGCGIDPLNYESLGKSSNVKKCKNCLVVPLSPHVPVFKGLVSTLLLAHPHHTLFRVSSLHCSTKT